MGQESTAEVGHESATPCKEEIEGGPVASQQEGDVVGLGDSCAEVSSLSGRRPVIAGHRDCQEALDLEHAPRLLPSAISRAQGLFEEAPWKGVSPASQTGKQLGLRDPERPLR